MTSSATRLEGAVATSVRARWCIGGVVAGSVAFAVIAGVPNAPVTTPLPRGAARPAWAVDVARWLGLARVGRVGLVVVSLLVMAGMLAAFGFLLAEAWSGRVRTRTVLVGAALALAAVVAGPLLLSRDVFSYAAYARVDAVHHLDPYVAHLASIHHDPFVAVTSAQWLHTHSVYGPLFTLLSEGVVRVRPVSPDVAILAFKVLAGLGIAAAAACTAVAARAIRPE